MTNPAKTFVEVGPTFDSNRKFNRHNNPRNQVGADGVLQYSGKKLSFQVRNVSKTGCKISICQDFPRGELLTLEINTPRHKKNKILSIDATVRWTGVNKEEGDWNVGLQYLEAVEDIDSYF